MSNPIRKAIENLPGRWYKGTYADGNGNFCGLGHVGHVMGAIDINGEFSYDGKSFKQYDAAENIMSEIAREQYPERYGFNKGTSFAVFNDHEDTTEDEALRIMDKAAVVWDETQA
jgi:hypothetical protein